MVAFVGQNLLSGIAARFGVRQAYKVYDMKAPVLSLVPGLYVKNAVVPHQADIPRHPVEDGSFISDHKIIQPRVVQIEGFCINQDSYNLMVQTFSDRTNLFGVQVKEILVENCTFGEFVPTRDSKVLNAIPVSFTMYEILQVAVAGQMDASSVKAPRDASTIKRGQTQTALPPADQGRSDVASGIGNL